MGFPSLATSLMVAGLLVSVGAHAASPARTLLNENRLDEAAIICRQIEVLSTIDSDNFAACAWVFFRTDKAESAERFMEKLRKGAVTPEYQLLTAFSQLKKKNFDGTKNTLNALAEEHRGGNLGMAIQELNAEMYETMGQFDTAAFIYKQLASEDPTRARAHWSLARYYLSKGDIARAVTHLEATAKIWPKHMGSRYNLAVLKIQEGVLPEAARWLAECYKINRADPGVLEQLGLLFEKKGALADAVRYWQKAVALSKDTPIAKEKLGFYIIQAIDTLIEGKQFDKALAQLEAHSKNLGKDPNLLFRRAVIYRNLSKYDLAIRDLKAYRATAPDDAAAIRELGMCYVNLKLYDQAGSSFVRALELEPENGLNYAWLAYVLEGKGKLNDAREAWKRAVQYLTEPDELERARRRLAAVEKRMPAGKKDKPVQDVEPKAKEEASHEEEALPTDAESKKPAWEDGGTKTRAQIPRS
jgi:tetratricopeptide (TPR) repeat protein